MNETTVTVKDSAYDARPDAAGESQRKARLGDAAAGRRFRAGHGATLYPLHLKPDLEGRGDPDCSGRESKTTARRCSSRGS